MKTVTLISGFFLAGLAAAAVQPPFQGDAPPPPGAPPAQGPGMGPPPPMMHGDPKAHAEGLARELKLSESQKKQVESILKEAEGAMRKLNSTPPDDMQKRHEAMQKLHRGTHDKIAKVLDAKQKKRFEEMTRQMPPPMMGPGFGPGRQGPGHPGMPAPPQGFGPGQGQGFGPGHPGMPPQGPQGFGPGQGQGFGPGHPGMPPQGPHGFGPGQGQGFGPGHPGMPPQGSRSLQGPPPPDHPAMPPQGMHPGMPPMPPGAPGQMGRGQAPQGMLCQCPHCGTVHHVHPAMRQPGKAKAKAKTPQVTVKKKRTA